MVPSGCTFQLNWYFRRCPGRLKALRTDTNVYRYNEKGERVYLDAAARDTEIAQNQKIMRGIGCVAAIQP